MIFNQVVRHFVKQSGYRL